MTNQKESRAGRNPCVAEKYLSVFPDDQDLRTKWLFTSSNQAEKVELSEAPQAVLRNPILISRVIGGVTGKAHSKQPLYKDFWAY